LQGSTFTRLLLSVFGTDLPENVYLRFQDVAKSIPSTDTSLASERVRGFRIWCRCLRVVSVATREVSCWSTFLLRERGDISTAMCPPAKVSQHDG